MRYVSLVMRLTVQGIDDLCLAFINETSDQWECIDTSLILVEEFNDTIAVIGKTNHFSNFAVLLKGSSNSNGTMAVEEGTNDESVPSWVYIVAVVGGIVVVAIGCIIVSVIIHRKRSKERRDLGLGYRFKATDTEPQSRKGSE